MSNDGVLQWIYEIAKKDPFHEEGEILGSMTTAPVNEAVRLVLHYLSKNLGDPRLFESLGALSNRLMEVTKEYLDLPSEYSMVFTSGGTEGNIIGLYALKRFSGRRKLVYPDTVHHSVFKACLLLDLECYSVPTDINGVMDYSKLSDYLSGNDKIMVVTLGSTELGSVDDIGYIMDWLIDTSTPLHIDAAFGGFTFPFTHREKFARWIEQLSNNLVFTFSSDYHKFPGAPVPSGMILFAPEIEEFFGFSAPYMPLGKQWGLLGTRPGFSVAASLATLLYYGKNGLASMAISRYEDTLWFLENVRKILPGLKTNVPDVPISCIRLHDKALSDGLFNYLWDNRLYVYKCSRFPGIRIVHMPHVKREVLIRLLDKIKEYMEDHG